MSVVDSNWTLVKDPDFEGYTNELLAKMSVQLRRAERDDPTTVVVLVASVFVLVFRVLCGFDVRTVAASGGGAGSSTSRRRRPTKASVGSTVGRMAATATATEPRRGRPRARVELD